MDFFFSNLLSFVKRFASPLFFKSFGTNGSCMLICSTIPGIEQRESKGSYYNQGRPGKGTTEAARGTATKGISNTRFFNL